LNPRPLDGKPQPLDHDSRLFCVSLKINFFSGPKEVQPPIPIEELDFPVRPLRLPADRAPGKNFQLNLSEDV